MDHSSTGCRRIEVDERTARNPHYYGTVASIERPFPTSQPAGRRDGDTDLFMEVLIVPIGYPGVETYDVPEQPIVLDRPAGVRAVILLANSTVRWTVYP